MQFFCNFWLINWYPKLIAFQIIYELFMGLVWEIITLLSRLWLLRCVSDASQIHAVTWAWTWTSAEPVFFLDTFLMWCECGCIFLPSSLDLWSSHQIDFKRWSMRFNFDCDSILNGMDWMEKIRILFDDLLILWNYTGNYCLNCY